MFLDLVKRGVTYIKELHEMVLYTLMSNEGIFNVFIGTPFYYVLMPMIGLLLTLTSLIKGYELFKVEKKTLDPLLDLIASALTATLASIALYGSVIATYFSFNFSVGPWLFLASIGVSLIHQLTMAGINIHRASKSVTNSISRMHFVQASLNNFFNLSLTAAITGAIVFVMLTSIAPAVGSAFALTAVALSGLHILWQMLPQNWKKGIKELLGLSKPELTIKPIKVEIPLDLINFAERFKFTYSSNVIDRLELQSSMKIKSVLASNGVFFDKPRLDYSCKFFKEDSLSKDPLPLHTPWIRKQYTSKRVDKIEPKFTDCEENSYNACGVCL